MSFDGALLQELNDALCDAFVDTDSFAQRMILGFGKKIAPHFGAESLATRVFRISDWAAAEDRQDQLVRVARRARPDAATLRAFEKLHLGAFSTEHLMALETLLFRPTLTTETVIAKGRAAAPADVAFPSPMADPEDARTAFRRVVDRLASCVKQSDDSVPLCTFAEDVRPAEVGEAALHEWISGLPISGIRSRRRPLCGSVYLFVKCDSGYLEKVTERDPVAVTMWLWQLDGHGRPIAAIPERVCDRTQVVLRDVADLVSRVRKAELTPYLERTQDRLVVAFCVSRAVLAVEVERWEIDYGNERRKVGSLYPVVVRSYERLYGGLQDTWGMWSRRWSELRARTRHDAASFAWFCAPVGADELADRVYPSQILCAALTHGAGAALVPTPINAGLPAVVWVRAEECTPEIVRDELERLVNDDFTNLPELMLRERQRHRHPAGINPLARVAVLWDDFDLFPPDVRAPFAAPTR